MNPKLKPCPFCGEQPTEYPKSCGSLDMVGCGNKKCHAQPAVVGLTMPVTRRRWNKRAKGE